LTLEYNGIIKLFNVARPQRCDTKIKTIAPAVHRANTGSMMA